MEQTDDLVGVVVLPYLEQITDIISVPKASKHSLDLKSPRPSQYTVPAAVGYKKRVGSLSPTLTAAIHAPPQLPSSLMASHVPLDDNRRVLGLRVEDTCSQHCSLVLRIFNHGLSCTYAAAIALVSDRRGYCRPDCLRCPRWTGLVKCSNDIKLHWKPPLPL